MNPKSVGETTLLKSRSEIMDRISAALSLDGFSEPSNGIFVKKRDDVWRGWIAVDPGSHLLIPTVGIFSEDLLDMRVRVLKKLGARWKKRKDGPPLIKENLHQLIDDEDRSRISWFYTGKELQPHVADDVVYLLRKNAYPYIEAHSNLGAILDAVMNKGRATPALPLYLPMILLKLERFDYLSTLINTQKEIAVCQDMSISYRQYINAILEIAGIEM